MSVADKIGFGPKREIEMLGHGPDRFYRITVTPPAWAVPSGTLPGVVCLTPEQMERYQQWRDGKLIQNALPELTDSEREILQTGLRNPL